MASKDSLLSLFMYLYLQAVYLLSFIRDPRSVPGHSHGLLWTCAEKPPVLSQFCPGSATQTPNAGGLRRWAVRCW